MEKAQNNVNLNDLISEMNNVDDGVSKNSLKTNKNKNELVAFFQKKNLWVKEYEYSDMEGEIENLKIILKDLKNKNFKNNINDYYEIVANQNNNKLFNDKLLNNNKKFNILLFIIFFALSVILMQFSFLLGTISMSMWVILKIIMEHYKKDIIENKKQEKGLKLEGVCQGAFLYNLYKTNDIDFNRFLLNEVAVMKDASTSILDLSEDDVFFDEVWIKEQIVVIVKKYLLLKNSSI